MTSPAPPAPPTDAPAPPAQPPSGGLPDQPAPDQPQGSPPPNPGDPFAPENMPSVGTPPDTPTQPDAPPAPPSGGQTEPTPGQPEPPLPDFPIIAATPEEAYRMAQAAHAKVTQDLAAVRKELADTQAALQTTRESQKALALENAANAAIARRWLWQRYSLDTERESVTGLEWDDEKWELKGEAAYNPPRGDWSGNAPTTTPQPQPQYQMPQPRFDPYTGQPIPQQQQPGQRYDAMSGEAVDEFGSPLTGWLPPGERDPGPDRLTP